MNEAKKRGGVEQPFAWIVWHGAHDDEPVSGQRGEADEADPTPTLEVARPPEPRLN